jgi:hypothetical protein
MILFFKPFFVLMTAMIVNQSGVYFTSNSEYKKEYEKNNDNSN